jgi:hypothetical protein
MARPTPRDPEMLAALIAVLRATATSQPSETEAVSTVAARARQEVDPAVAARLVKRFDRINPAIRRKALGEWLDRPVELTDRQVGADAGSVPVESGGNGGFGGRLGSEASRPGEVSETVTDGHPAADPAAVVPTYTISYRGMFAEAETTWDGFTNSDEVYFQTFASHIAADGENTIRKEQHPIDQPNYEDVDDGEPRIGPVAAVWKGDRVPMSLTVVAFEHDYGDPNKYREEIAAIVAAAALLVNYVYAPSALLKGLIAVITPLIIDGINWLLDTGDDRIGEPFIAVLDLPTIERYSGIYPSPYGTDDGNSLDKLQGHFFSDHRGSGAHYVAAFQVDREPALDRNANVVIV